MDAFSPASPVIRRTLTPYGTPAAGSGAWPDDRTFLNDPSDAAAGLAGIGARKYDPAAGTFISPDPVLDPGSPQTMAGYTYAAGNPVTGSDPTGLSAAGASICTGSVYCNGPGDGPPAGWTGPGYTTSAGGGTGSGPGGTSGTSHVTGGSGQPGASGSCRGYYRTCHLREVHRIHPGHGPFNLFGWVTHTAAPWVAHHWRGLAQIGIIGGGIICVASGVCVAIAGTALSVIDVTSISAVTVGGSLLAGSAVGAGDYAASGGRHSAEGYAVATFEGAASGAVGGGWSVLAKSGAYGPGLTFAGALVLRGSAGADAYLVNHGNVPEEDQSLWGISKAFLLGSSRALSVLAKALLSS